MIEIQATRYGIYFMAPIIYHRIGSSDYPLTLRQTLPIQTIHQAFLISRETLTITKIHVIFTHVVYIQKMITEIWNCVGNAVYCTPY